MALYYYKDAKGKLDGPLTEIHLLDLRDAGKVQDDTPVCDADAETWSTLGALNLTRPDLEPNTLMTRLGVLAAIAASLFALLYFVSHHDFGFKFSPGHFPGDGPVVAAFGPPLDQLPITQPSFHTWQAYMNLETGREASLPPDTATQLEKARQSAVLADPNLASEAVALEAQIQAEAIKYEAALVQVDPPVKPITAKLDQARPRLGHVSLELSRGPVSLSAEELAELAKARKAALAAQPQLIAETNALEKKLEDFRHDLDSAALKFDSSLGPFISTVDAVQ